MQTAPQVANDAVQGILSRIDQLATKLGTTAAQLWNVYVAESRVEEIRDAGLTVILLVTAGIFGTFVRRALWKNVEDALDDLPWTIATVLSVVLAGGLVASAVWTAYQALPEFLNPQYWAFQHLTADLKNLF